MNQKLVWDVPAKISKGTGDTVLEICGLDREGSFDEIKLLDFGCGEGRYMRLFAEVLPLGNIAGVEVIPERIEKLNEEGFNTFLLPLDGNSFPFDDESFDIVFSSNVIEHIPHAQYLEYLADVKRVLKPHGRFAVGTPNYPAKRLFDMVKAIRTEYTRYYLFDDPTHCNKLSVQQLEKDLREHFSFVDLDVTFDFLQTRVKWLQNAGNRKKIRRLSDKIFGYCLK